MFRDPDEPPAPPPSSVRQLPLALRSPEDAIATVPLLLGFAPEHSVVLIVCDRTGGLSLTCRVDLPQADDAHAWSHEVVDVIGRAAGGRARDALLVAFAPTRHEQVVRRAVPALATLLESRGLRVVDQLWSWGRRWRSLSCPDLDCCPPGGRRVSAAARARARSAFPGRDVKARRQDLRAALDPADSDAVEEVSRLLAAMEPVDENLRDIAISQAHDLLVNGCTRPRDAALVLAALRDTRVRDTLIWDVLHAPRRTWPPMRSALESIVRWAPRGDAAAAATILGILSWQCGDGTRANVALQRAREDDPGYSLATLIDASLAAGMPPGEWLAGLRGLPRDACRGRG